MIDFDEDPNSDDYPEKLREVREKLGMTQKAFGEEAGHSGVMQGRYETVRSKRNAAVPSEWTARSIRKMIARVSSAPKPDATSSDTPTASAPRSLKAVTIYEIEQAIASAIGTLIGTQCKVTVKDVVWSADNASDAAISLSVAT